MIYYEFHLFINICQNPSTFMFHPTQRMKWKKYDIFRKKFMLMSSNSISGPPLIGIDPHRHKPGPSEWLHGLNIRKNQT